MYVLKQIPEDFIVQEVSSYQLKEQGKYLCFLLEKKGRNTMDVLNELARILHIPVKEIGFSGAKDKHAITTQICSVRSFGKISKKSFESINLSNVTLTPLGFLDTPITLGSHDSNKFVITLRNLNETCLIYKRNYFVNYFDEQRFSSNNVAIGRHIVKKQFNKAVEFLDDEKVQEHIQNRKNDFIGALKQVPKRLLMMYVHAYQSFIWNTIVARYLESIATDKTSVTKVAYSCGEFVFLQDKALEKIKDLSIPLPGFVFDEDSYSDEIMPIVDQLFDEEDIDFSDFVIRQVPYLSQEGVERKVVETIINCTVSDKSEDELNEGAKKQVASFELGKGSYATMVIRHISNV